MKMVWVRRIVIGLAAVAGAAAGVWWLNDNANFNIGADNLQKAEIIKIEEPAISKIEDGKTVPQPVKVLFSKNIAKVSLLDGEVGSGIEIYPSLRGKWRFETASILSFVPENDWIPGREYEVKLTKDILAPGVELQKDYFKFRAPKFSGKAIEGEFYEDPRNRKNKSVVAGFEFSYPVQEDSIKQAVKVRAVDGKTYDFSYKLADDGRKLYIISAPLKIETQENFITVSVSGVKNSVNAAGLSKPVSIKVKVPALASFFSVKSITSEIVKNKQQNDNPEQILKLDFSTKVDVGVLQEYLQAFYSDVPCYQLRENWGKAGNDPRKLKDLKTLELQPVEHPDANSYSYWFRYNLAERGKCLLTVVKKGLSSVDNFMLTNDVVQILPEADYPLEAKVAYSGAVLPLKSNPKLEFMARGVKELQVKLARIESDDLNNLVTQTGGQFASPYFINYNFNQDNMAQVFERKIPLNMQNPAEVTYASLDLKPYLGKEKGIFIVLLKGRYDEYNFSPEDRRLIVVTDLGLVVKDNLDKSHDIFVSSISLEKPVANAKVEVLGKNGLSVVTTKTDAKGQAKLPDLSGFENEKQPVAYKVSLNGDVSYLPINRYDLRVNFSRFAVEGIYVPEDKPDGLNGYIFSDRGVYRPGEKVNLGIILRQNNLEVPAHLPLQVEIINPRGETAATGKLVSSDDGLMEYAYKIPAAADTGYYNLTLYRLDDKQEKVYVASGYFRVEEFEADTMKLKLSFEGENAKGWLDLSDIGIDAKLTNLYGNPAIGHQIKARYSLYPSGFYFEQYEGYVFDDPLKDPDNKAVRAQEGQLAEATTNEAGEANLKIDLTKYAKGTYRLSVDADGLEAGSGRGVSARISAFVSPNKYLIGYKADGNLQNIAKNSSRGVKLIAINPDLQKIAKKVLTLELKKRDYISNLTEMPNGTYKYQTVAQEKLVREEKWALPEEGRKLQLDTSEPGEFVLYLMDGKTVAAKIEYSVSAAENAVMAIDKDASLIVKLNKEQYNSLDEIQMEIMAPYAGYGLITIERDSVYAAQWFKSETTNAKASIKLPQGVEGNAYVNVAWFRSLNSEEIFMSPLSYAVVPFAINKAAREIKIDLEVPQKVRPGEKLTIKYKTSKPAEIIVWGVNEGILQVADYQTPNPLDFFMKKKALRVITAQIMDMIMPDVGVARFIKAPGGGAGMAKKMMRAMADEMAMNKNPFARKLNKVTAFWSGIVKADEQQKEVSYEVPETFSGQIRVMAVAVNANQFGSREKEVLVRGDFAISPSGPFSAAPGDEFTVGVGLANLVEGSGKDYKIRLTADAGDGLQILSPKEQVVALAENDEKTFAFQAKALDILGSAEIHFKAEALDDSDKKAGMPYYVGIRPAVPYMTNLQMGYREDKLELKNFLIKMYPQYRSQMLSASTSPLVLASGLLKYLDKFEHWCTEQTVSKAYPAMEIMFRHPDLVDSDAVYKQFDEAIAVLSERQKLNGGFSSWPVAGLGENKAVSLYAAEFLVMAEKKAMNVPSGLLAKTLQFVRASAAEKPQGLDDIDPAYAAYILTKSGEITTNYLLNLEQELAALDSQNWKNGLSAAYLAASYQLLQNEPKALAVLGKYQWGKNKLNDARYVYLMAETFPFQFQTWRQQNIEALLSPLESGYYNTWSAAYSILAMNAFAGSSRSDQEIKFAGHQANYKVFAELDLTAEDNKIEVVSPNPFFYSLRQQGYQEGRINKAESAGIEVAKEYRDMKGNKISKAKLGDEIEVVIKLRSLTGEDIADTAIVDLLPGGVDIVRNSITSEAFIDFSEAREDRMLAYMTVVPAGEIIRYKVTAISRGKFAVPPVYASAMYNIMVRAHGVTDELEIE